jgi:hypothetical protein
MYDALQFVHLRPVDESERVYPTTKEPPHMAPKVSPTPTAYATICRGGDFEGDTGCGQVFMTAEFYNHQMSNPDATWRCASCGREAEFDDSNWEKVMKIS